MNKYNSNEEIFERLKTIFKERFEIDLGKSSQEDMDNHFLGKEFRMPPRDLIYLFFDIEREFEITIPEEDIVSGRFGTINNIIGIIEEQLAAKHSAEVEKEAI